MKDEELRAQIDALICDEIHGINDYIDETEKDTEVAKEEADELKVKISNDGVDKLIKEYKRIKKSQRSNLGQVRLLDQHGRRINKN